MTVWGEWWKKKNGINEEQDLGYGDSYMSDETVDSRPWYEKIIPKPELPYKRILITQKAFEKMYHYTNAAFGEISGFGKTRIEGKDIIVEDVYIFKQECSAGYTELNDEVISKWVVEMARKKLNPADYQLWWHSHNDFSVFFSGIDTANIDRHSKDTRLISTCINKMGDIVGRVDEKGNTKDLPIVRLPLTDEFKEECIKEVKEKVSKIEYKYTGFGWWNKDKDNKNNKGDNYGFYETGGYC